MTIINLKIAADADGTTAYVRLCSERTRTSSKLLWVKSRHVPRKRSCPLYPKAGMCGEPEMSASVQKRTSECASCNPDD